MEKLPLDFDYPRKVLKRHCEFGFENFCDGRANKSYNKNAAGREPCIYFFNGRCSKNEIIYSGDRRRERE